MNNINTVENARAVVTEAKAAEVSSKPATADDRGGKTLPSEVRTAAAEQAVKPSAKAAQQVDKAVEQLNDYVQTLQRDLRFSVDEELGRAIVHVVDSKTQEVIRQIPNETALRLARNLNQILQKQALEAQAPRIQSQGTVDASHSLGLINTRI
jgi:flagellar protein FlaG